jgi:hypothetical protein
MFGKKMTLLWVTELYRFPKSFRNVMMVFTLKLIVEKMGTGEMVNGEICYSFVEKRRDLIGFGLHTHAASSSIEF